MVDRYERRRFEFPPTSRRKGRFRSKEGFHLPCDSARERPKGSSFYPFLYAARSIPRDRRAKRRGEVKVHFFPCFLPLLLTISFTNVFTPSSRGFLPSALSFSYESTGRGKSRLAERKSDPLERWCSFITERDFCYRGTRPLHNTRVDLAIFPSRLIYGVRERVSCRFWTHRSRKRFTDTRKCF